MGISRARGTGKFDGATLVLANGGTGQTTLSTASTATRVWSFQDATDTVVGRATTDTLTNKTLTSPALTTPTITAGTATGLTHLSVNDTAGFNLRLRAVSSSPALSADRILTFNVNDDSRTISLDGNVAVGADFATAGGTLTLTADAGGSSVTLPASGTLSTLAGSESLSNKTLVTPVLGVATATSINKLAITAPATGSTLAVADGKTFTASNTLTLTGTDGSSVAFGAGGTVAYQGGTLAQFAATTSAQLAATISDETGSGALVFASAPNLVNPVVSGTMVLQNLAGSQPAIQFSEDPDNGTNSMTMRAASDIATSFTLTWPDNDGSTNNVLSTDGAGNLSWTAAAVATATDGWIYELSNAFASLAFASNDNKLAGVNSDGTSAEYKAIAVGSSGTDFAVAHSAGTITLNLPDASASNRGAVTTGTQTIAGDKTLTGTTTIGPASSDSTVHTVNGSLAVGTAIPSWSDASRRYIGSRYGAMQWRDGDNSAGSAGLSIFGGVYFDGTNTRLSSSSLYASALHLVSNSASSNTAFLFRSYASGTAADVASATDVGTAAFTGFWTLGSTSTSGSRVGHKINIAGADSGSAYLTLETKSTLATNGNSAGYRNDDNGNFRSFFGMIKTAGCSDGNSCGAIQWKRGSAANTDYIWSDSSGNLLVSGTEANVGSTTGTVVGTQTSDARIKDNITAYTHGLAVITAMAPKAFVYKERPDKAEIGFLAQDVLELIPEAVYNTGDTKCGEDNILAMQYTAIIPALVNAIKELKQQFDDYAAAHP